MIRSEIPERLARRHLALADDDEPRARVDFAEGDVAGIDLRRRSRKREEKREECEWEENGWDGDG